MSSSDLAAFFVALHELTGKYIEALKEHAGSENPLTWLAQHEHDDSANGDEPNDNSMNGKKKKKPRKKKDPNEPKRPLTSYLLFTEEVRPTLKETHPELSAKEMMSKMGSMWRSLTPEEKKHYDEIYHENLEVFKAKMQEYKETKKGSDEYMEDAVEQEDEHPTKPTKKKKKKSNTEEPVEEPEEPAPTPKKSSKKRKKEAVVIVDEPSNEEKQTEEETAPKSSKKRKKRKSSVAEEQETSPEPVEETPKKKKKSKKKTKE